MPSSLVVAPPAALIAPPAVPSLSDDAPVLSPDEHQLEERERQRIVDRVLQRAHAAKLARTFRAHLELAAFKAERGWHTATLNEIEPHMEAEEAKRRSEEEAQRQQLLHYQQQQQVQQHHPQQPQYRQEPGLMGPPQTTLKRQRGGSLANASMANTTMYDHQPYQNGHPSPHTYPNPMSYQPTASTSALPSPRPIHAASPFPPHIPSPAPVSDSHRQKRRQTTASESLPLFLTGAASPPRRPLSAGPHSSSPRARNSASRSSISSSAVRPLPLSSSDPTFSSFVDAASVLSGLSRGSSDPNVLSQTDSPPAPSPRPSSNGSGAGMLGGTPGLGQHGSATGMLVGTPGLGHAFPSRPQTPPTLQRDDKGNIVAGSENDTAGAAELMLFLAASPSPAQGRSGAPSLALGGGVDGTTAMKGRRLFSSGQDDLLRGQGGGSPADGLARARNVFGGPIDDGAFAVGLSPLMDSNSFGSGGGTPYTSYLTDSGPSFDDPNAYNHPPPPLTATTSSFSLRSAPPSGTSSSSAPPPSNGNNGHQHAPTTPSRDRNSGSWETYLNVSPSPQHQQQRVVNNNPPPFSMPLTSLSPTSLLLGRGQGAGW